MSQPNIRPGSKVVLPNEVYISAGSGQMIALPGVQSVEVINTISTEEDTDASIVQKGDRATYSKLTGKVTITGKTVGFLGWANGYQSVSTTDAFHVIADVAVVAGAGTLAYTPLSETGGLSTASLWDDDGDTLDQVTGTPGAGEYQITGTTLTVGDAPTAGYIASYLADSSVGTPTGTKFDLDFTNKPPRCNQMWLGGVTINPAGLCEYTGSKAEVLVLKHVQFHGDIPVYTAQAAEKTYELAFTANIWTETDLYHYMPQEPEGE